MQIYECKYCLKKFTDSEKYNSHDCREKRRTLFLETKAGLRAYKYYTIWFKQMGRVAPSKETFIISRFFESFKNFDEFSIKIMLPNPEFFIRFMVQKNILPMLWNKSEFYEMYIVSYDDFVDPIKQVHESINYIKSLARGIGCKEIEIFSYLYVDDIYKLIQSKKLSPWFLLNSKLFFRYMQTSLSSSEKIVIGNLITLSKWSEKFKSYAETVENIKKIVESFGF